MKKMIAFLLALAVLLCCVACSGEKDEKETTTASQSPEESKPSVDGDATVLTIGGYDVSVKLMNYFFMETINQWYSSQGSMIMYSGLDFQKPLDEQINQTTGTTWGDYFLSEAVEFAKSTYAKYDAAMKAGYTLTETENAQLQAIFDNINQQAKDQKFENGDALLKSIYGDVSDVESYREYATVYFTGYFYTVSYSDTLQDGYTEEMLREFEEDTPYLYNNYSYASFYLNLDKFKMGGTKGADGKTVYSDEEIAAAKELLAAAAAKLSAADINTVEKLNEAIKVMEQELAQAKGEEIEDGKYSVATENTDMAYSRISSLMQEWIRDKARTEGEITAIPYESVGTDENGKEVKSLAGYYVILFQKCNDNNVPLANVRHILIAFEGGTTNSTTGQTIYSEQEKEKAKNTAQELLTQWLEGDATEESFAQLANKHSTDPGSNTNGGLYEDVYPGMMVTNFNDWCFDESRQTGDYGIVETSYGYHLMFYAGDSQQTYRNLMVSNEKLNADMNEWHEALVDAIDVVEVDLDLVDTNRVLA